MPNFVLLSSNYTSSAPLRAVAVRDRMDKEINIAQCTTIRTGGATLQGGPGGAMAHPTFWLGGPQCIWLHQ